IAAKAGPAWPMWLDASAGADLAARTAALEALRDRFPRDPELAAGLTAAYREAGRADACLAEGKRALANDPDAAAVHRELVWCQLLAGDEAAASDEADRYAKAAGERAVRGAASARRQTVTLVNTDRTAAALAARVWALASMGCGDVTSAREAEDFATRRLPGSGAAEAIGNLISGARGTAGAFAHA